MDKATEIIEFFLDNKDGFKDQVKTNLGSLTHVDSELTSIFDEISENKIDISLDEILEESMSVVLKAIETFEDKQ